MMRRGLAPPDLSMALPLLTAALPRRLVEATAQLAQSSIAGRLAAQQVISASVANLLLGVLRTMFITKLKVAAAALLLVMTGSAVLVSQATAQKPSTRQGIVSSPAARSDEAAPRNDELDIAMLERAWAEAIPRRDAAVVNRVVADDFEGIDPVGNIYWPLVLMLIPAGPRPGPLADIGPAPRTVLVSSAGKSFDLASLRGKVVLVSFVYTTCNGVCSATTLSLSRIQNTLEQAKLWGTSVEFVSITLDPKRDTPEVLNHYAQIFGADLARWHFLTGSPSQVESAIAAWGMWAKSDPTGAIDHPSRIFLLDPRGHEREIYNLEFLKGETVLEDVRTLLAERA
jgi:protein SCO1